MHSHLRTTRVWSLAGSAFLNLRRQTMTQRVTHVKKKNKRTTNQNGSSSTKCCITYRIQKRSMVYSASSGTQPGGHSYLSQSCMRPAFNILCIPSGDGCYTAVACRCRPSRVKRPATLLSLLTTDLAALASETRIAMCGVAGIVSWTLERQSPRCL